MGFKGLWMKRVIAGDQATVERLAERLKRAKSHLEYQRIQCVLILATLGSPAADIACLLGWSTARVHLTHSLWARKGEAIFEVRPRGGRRYQYLTHQQEQELLAPFERRALAGEVPRVAEIRQAYQERVGKAVARSTVYRLMWRHGWRKDGAGADAAAPLALSAK